jgi:muramoyltetrapeptide carboxypeptidase
MLKPRALKDGDRIAVVAPASPFARDEFDRGVQELRRLGFEPTFDDTVFSREADYLAGPADVRATDFMRHWEDPTVAALVAVRGGYGSVQMLPLLDRDRLRSAPKLFIGYSDNTSLLSWLTCACGITALHGPMLEGRFAGGPPRYDERSFLSLSQNGLGCALAPAEMIAIHPGEASGPLFGGTLTQLVASLGTPYAFDPPERCILFVEDVNERPYRIDRMMTQLRLSGILDRASGLVFGEMRGCHEPGGAVTARQVIERMTTGFDGPVLFGFPSGHTSGPCWTLPLGVRVRVTAAPVPSIVIEEAAVAV